MQLVKDAVKLTGTLQIYIIMGKICANFQGLSRICYKQVLKKIESQRFVNSRSTGCLAVRSERRESGRTNTKALLFRVKVSEESE